MLRLVQTFKTIPRIKVPTRVVIWQTVKDKMTCVNHNTLFRKGSGTCLMYDHYMLKNGIYNQFQKFKVPNCKYREMFKTLNHATILVFIVILVYVN